jgi:molybdopterin/thiamine biosynthesis adenylyltransferase
MPEHAAHFDHATAFSRTVGWVTRDELARLEGARVAIAGLGGVGGIHLTTLCRLGIGAFHIADLDIFELQNFNRQAGAFMHTIGRPKAEVLEEIARGINPELQLRTFDRGVTPENVDDFLAGVDVYVDGLDFFALSARRMVFAACARLGIPAVTAAPLGMSSALMTFMPGGMSFEDYFGLEGQPELEQLIRLFVGLAPKALQQAYLVDPNTLDLAARKGPSTPMACDICAGLVGTEVLKIVLGRGRVNAAPWGLQFDAYRQRLTRTWRPGGNRHPLNRLILAAVRRRFAGRSMEPAE